jgi:hypothetical protein
MRLCAGSIVAGSAAVWACGAVTACTDRPALETPFEGARDAGSTADDGPIREGAEAGRDAPPDGTPPEPFDPLPWKSGFRLRAKIKDGGDGAKLLDRWEDPVLRFDCTFAIATDGRQRCLPVDEDLPILTTFYADADCTKFIAIGPPPDQRYVRIVDERCGRSDDDDKPIQVVRWGGVAKVDAPYILRSGVCSPITNGPAFVWNSIAEADPVQFVAAQEHLHVAPDGSAARVLIAEDGSHENSRLVDPRTAKACEVVSDHVLGGPDVCVPTPFAAAPTLPFSDTSSCDKAIAFAEAGCDHAYAGLMLRRVDCKYGVDVVELGASFPTESTGIFRRYADGVCRSDMLFTPMTGYVVRRPFPPGAFAPAITRAFGSGRLEARLHATSDGLVVRNARVMPLRYQLDPDSPTPVLQPAPFEFYDKELQTKCRVDTAADDTLRCIPTRTVPKLGEYFEDEACTLPAHLGSNDAGCMSSGFVVIPGWLEVGLNVPPPSEIRPIGAVLDKPMFMYAPHPSDPSMPPRGTCIPVPPDTGRVFYALGPRVPISQLARVIDAFE